MLRITSECIDSKKLLHKNLKNEYPKEVMTEPA